MLTLRALAMEKVFTQDLSPDSCPKTLLKEMQTLKKARNIALNQYSCRSKRRLLRMLWTNLIIESDNITVMDRRRTRYLAHKGPYHLDEALIWFRVLATQLAIQMNETAKEAEKLMKCIPLEYHYMCFKNLVNNYETFIDEIKQRLLEIIDEDYEYGLMIYGPDATGDVTRSFQNNRKYSRHVINCLNFAF